MSASSSSPSVTFTHGALPPPPGRISDVSVGGRISWERGAIFYSPGPARPEWFHHPLGQDTHRWVARLLSELGDDPSATDFVNRVVFPLVFHHGGLYDTEQTHIPRPMSAWYKDLKRIAAAVEASPARRQDLIGKRFHWAKTGPRPAPSGASLILDDGVRFHASSLLGWMWVLIVRDAIENVTYADCEGCGDPSRGFFPRQIAPPSPPIPGKRLRQLRFCGRRCKTRHYTRLRRAKQTRESREEKRRAAASVTA